MPADVGEFIPKVSLTHFENKFYQRMPFYFLSDLARTYLNMLLVSMVKASQSAGSFCSFAALLTTRTKNHYRLIAPEDERRSVCWLLATMQCSDSYGRRQIQKYPPREILMVFYQIKIKFRIGLLSFDGMLQLILISLSMKGIYSPTNLYNVQITVSN